MVELGEQGSTVVLAAGEGQKQERSQSHPTIPEHSF